MAPLRGRLFDPVGSSAAIAGMCALVFGAHGLKEAHQQRELRRLDPGAEHGVVGNSLGWHGYCTCPTWSGCPQQKKLWEVAVKEQGLSAVSLTKEQCDIPKIPHSWVRRVFAMDHEKVHTYNFMGSLTRGPTIKVPRKDRRRLWIPRFMRDNFGDHDYYKNSQPPNDYRRIGSYDKTVTSFTKPRFGSFDAEYFSVLCRSNFTLAPGGDAPYSMRFYEAILCSSIPVVQTQREDWSQLRANGTRSRMAALTTIPYKYYELKPDHARPLDLPLEYRRDWAEENLRLFLKHQTFLDPDATLGAARSARYDDGNAMVDAEEADVDVHEDQEDSDAEGADRSALCAVMPSEDCVMDCE